MYVWLCYISCCFIHCMYYKYECMLSHIWVCLFLHWHKKEEKKKLETCNQLSRAKLLAGNLPRRGLGRSWLTTSKSFNGHVAVATLKYLRLRWASTPERHVRTSRQRPSWIIEIWFVKFQFSLYVSFVFEFSLDPKNKCLVHRTRHPASMLTNLHWALSHFQTFSVFWASFSKDSPTFALQLRDVAIAEKSDRTTVEGGQSQAVTSCCRSNLCQTPQAANLVPSWLSNIAQSPWLNSHQCPLKL